MTKRKWTILMTASLALGLAMYATAQQQHDQHREDQDRNAADRTDQVARDMRVQKAGDLIGKRVKNEQGDDLGHIQNLAIAADIGKVVYAVLEFDRLADIGDKLFAIPFNSLDLSGDMDHFILTVSKDRLKTAQGFDRNNWPTMADERWATDVHTFYNEEPYWRRTGKDKDRGHGEFTTHKIRKASDLIGKNVQNQQGENLGDVKDLAIDPDNGRIAYCVLSAGGALGIGDKLFAVPWRSATLSSGDEHFVMNIDKDRLKNAPGFDPNNWPNMADRQWATDVHRYYAQRPYWELDVMTVRWQDRERERVDRGDAMATSFQRASDLIGKKVRNLQNEDLGEIKNLAIDPDRGLVNYAVLQFGGFLGMGDKHFAIPFTSLDLSADMGEFVLRVDKERLKNAQGFDPNTWPDMADRRWGRDIHTFYGARPYWEDENYRTMGRFAAEVRTTDEKERTAGKGHTEHAQTERDQTDRDQPDGARVQKASDLLGKHIKNRQNEDLGTVKDLMIDPERGRVRYAILEFGGFLGMGDKLFAVPFQSLDLPSDAVNFVLDINKERLKTAEGFDKRNWPSMTDPEWQRNIHKFYDARPYWEADRGPRADNRRAEACPACGLQRVAWASYNSDGVVKEGVAYCCQGCADGSGCTLKRT